MNIKDVTQLKAGERGKIIEIRGGYNLLKKLGLLGIRVGVNVIKISSQIMRGPITLRVGNSRIAIGYGMAKKILVRVEK